MRWLNSNEGLRLAEEQKALRVAEEQKKHKAREQQVAKEAEREEQQQQRDLNTPFTGMLALKTKADLQDIVQVLGLTTDGLKKDILARINVHFNANPILHDNLCFEGIFNWTRRWPAVQTEDETLNTTPAASAGLLSSVLLFLPPPLAPLSSNIVNTHLFSYTSSHPTSMIHPSLHPCPSFYPPHPVHPTLPYSPYHHPTSNVMSINPYSHYNSHLMQN